jgi:TPR repeat protein
LAIQSNAPNTWEMGGGRTWMNPPTANCQFKIPKCRPDLGANFHLLVIDSTVFVEAAAKRGYVPAMRQMGYMLFDGNKMQPDQEAAAGWFYEAAIRGDHASMIMLSHAFYNGIGVELDQKLADYWLKRAAGEDIEVIGRR